MTIHRLYGAVDIDGKIHRVKITIKENTHTGETPKAYSYEATKIELLAGQLGDVSSTSPRNSNNSTKIEQLAGQHEEAADVSEPSSRNSNNSISVANLLNGVEKSYEKGKKLLYSSKIVDENGEPLVVYHNSINRFNVFDKNKIGASTDDGLFGKGFYFGTVDHPTYGNVKYDTFLNIKNPYIVDSKNLYDLRYGNRSGEGGFTRGSDHRLDNSYLAENGYDGVLYKGNYDTYNEIVALDPNQIKSATENNGDFSNGNDDIRFSKEKRDIEAVNSRFNEELQKQIDGTLEKGHVYRMGNAGRKLQAGGFPDLPMEMRANTLIEKSSENYINEHPFDIEDVKDLPKAMNNPIAVFDSKTTAGSKVVLLVMKDKNGVNFIAAVSTNVPKSRYSRDGIQINSVRSIYPKGNIKDVIRLRRYLMGISKNISKPE